jgi:hypothetical protein
MARVSFISAKQHWDRFLASVPAADMEKLCPPKHPLGGLKYDTMNKENVSFKLMDRFSGYLLHGKWLHNKKKAISFLSADRYFSAIKNGIRGDLVEEHKENTPLANTVAMKSIRDGMKKGFAQRAIKNNVALVNSHETCNLDDHINVTTVCVWSNSEEMGCMFAYFNSLFHLAGRGVEVALIPFENISLFHPVEFPLQHEKIPLVRLWRSKTLLHQQLSMFPHRDQFLQDWCFALAYSMVMNTSPNEFLFPAFAAKASNAFRDVTGGAAEALAGPETELELAGAASIVDAAVDEVEAEEAAISVAEDDEVELEDADVNEDDELSEKAEKKKDKAKSQAVSKYYKNVIQFLVAKLDELNQAIIDAEVQAEAVEEVPGAAGHESHKNKNINPNISSHSNKRHAINVAEDHPQIKTQDTARRAGYDLKSIATIFEYMLKYNPFRDRQVSRVSNNWNAVTPLGTIGGGRPACLKAVVGHPEGAKADLFAATLFHAYDDIPKANDQEVRNLLLAGVLRFLPYFLDLLVKHPTHEFGYSREEAWTTHTFTLALVKAGKAVKIRNVPVTLMEWSDLVEKDFVTRNSAYVPMEAIMRAFPDSKEFMTDHRSLAGYLQAIAQAGHVNEVLFSELKSQVNTLTATVTTLTATVTALTAQSAHQLDHLARQSDQLLALMQTVTNGQGGAPNTDGDIDDDEGNDGNDGSITNEATAGDGNFPTDVKQLKVKPFIKDWYTKGYYKNMDASDSKQHRSLLKLTVEYFSMFLDSHIPPLPNGVDSTIHPNAEAWRRNLKALIAEAWERYEEVYGKGQSEKVSVFKRKMTERSSELWPPGPEGENSFQPPLGSKYRIRTRNEMYASREERANKKARTDEAAATQEVLEVTETEGATEVTATEGAPTDLFAVTFMN